MNFIHDDPDFPDLVRAIAAERNLGASLIEKDYWITHTLWALQEAGLAVSFKGGTSLSKAFGIIRRFSEDLDIRIAAGTSGLPSVGNWKSEGKAATADRKAFFQAIAALKLPGVALDLDINSMGEFASGARIRVDYPGAFKAGLPERVSAYVLLEIGEARFEPALYRPVSSWVHDRIKDAEKAPDFIPNWVGSLECAHPAITLVEKLDAITRRFVRSELTADAFVRHYEDATHVIQTLESLPALGDGGVASLALDMQKRKQIRKVPSPYDPAFNPDPTERWKDLAKAHNDIGSLFWGPRISLDLASRTIREFLGGLAPDLERDGRNPEDPTNGEVSGGGTVESLHPPPPQGNQHVRIPKRSR